MTLYTIQDFQKNWGTTPPVVVWTLQAADDHLRMSYIGQKEFHFNDKFTIKDLLIEQDKENNKMWYAYFITEDTLPREEWPATVTSDADFIIHEVEVSG